MTKITAKRFILISMVVLIWAAMGFYGINKGSDLFGIAALVTSISVPMGVFMHSETKRPSGQYKEK